MNVSHSSSRLSAVNTDEDWSLGNMSGGAISSTAPLSYPYPPPTLSLTGRINVEKVCSLSEWQRQEGHFKFFGSSCQTFSLISRQVCPEPAVVMSGHFGGCPANYFWFFFCPLLEARDPNFFPRRQKTPRELDFSFKGNGAKKGSRRAVDYEHFPRGLSQSPRFHGNQACDALKWHFSFLKG